MGILIFLVILFLTIVSYCLYSLYKSKQEYNELISSIVWEEGEYDE